MKLLRWIVVGLLFFTAASGLIGGVPLMTNPHGTPWQMPQSLLVHSPFDSYLVPGIVLFCANGLMPLGICIQVLRGGDYEILTMLQGCVLVGWIVAECVMIRLVIWPHYLYAGIGVALIVCGDVLGRAARRGAPMDSLVH